MSHKARISNKKVDKTLKHIEQIQKIVPHHKETTAQTPSSMLIDHHKIDEEQSQIITPSTPDVQPWLQDMQTSSQTLKKQQSIKRQINFMLGLNEEDYKQTQTQLQKADAKKIAKKLQKYQPANSSFSLYLSQIKGLQHLKRQQSEDNNSVSPFRLKALNLPPVPIPNSFRKAGNMTSRLKSIDRKRAISLNNASYIGQIKQIYSLGQTKSLFSGEMIEKIDKASQAIHNKFQQLNNKTLEMMDDVVTYHLQQESDRNYKNKLLSIPRWMMKKKA